MGRHNPLVDRLARLEASRAQSTAVFTLVDGRTERLAILDVLDAMGAAMRMLADPGAEHPAPSRTLRVLARVDPATETSVLTATAVHVAREVVALADEQEASR